MIEIKQTEEELLLKLADFVDPIDDSFTKKEMADFAKSLSETEHITEYLKHKQGESMRKFFNAQTDAQKSYIRGQYDYITKLLAIVVKHTSNLQK